MSSVTSTSGTTLRLKYRDASGNDKDLPFPLETVRTREPRFATGRIIWQEDFENGGSINSWFVFDGSKRRISRSAIRSFSGKYSLRLDAITGVLQDVARVIPLDSTTTKIVGIEYRMSYSLNIQTATGPAIGVALERYSTNTATLDEYQAFYRPDQKDFILDYDGTPGPRGGVGGVVTLAPYDSSSGVMLEAWHHIKLIVDLSQRIYKTLLVNNYSYDLTSPSTLGPYSTKTLPSGAQDTSILRIEPHLIAGTGSAGGTTPAQVYYDDFILTDET